MSILFIMFPAAVLGMAAECIMDPNLHRRIHNTIHHMTHKRKHTPRTFY